MSDNLNLVKRQREISQASHKVRDSIYYPVNGAADALKAKDAEIDYWKNRTREALETIKDNVARIAELEAALKPFADKATACEQRYSDFIPEDDRTFAFTLGDLRQARKVLGEEE